MNIKFLKFIVIFMGIIIFFGIILLGFSIYFKFKGLTNNINTKNIYIDALDSLNFVNHRISEGKIFLSYENDQKLIIFIYNLDSGEKVSEIEILK